jgi:hypothetical protein
MYLDVLNGGTGQSQSSPRLRLEAHLEGFGEGVGRLLAAFQEGVRRGLTIRTQPGSQQPAVNAPPSVARDQTAGGTDTREPGMVASDPEMHPQYDWYRD